MKPTRFLRHRGEQAFTLVELLLVVGIMAILTASVGPGLLRVMGGANLTQAGNRVTDLVALAHQDALNHNAMTAVVLLTNCSWDATLSGRALVPLRLQDGVWTQTGSWAVLPSSTRAYGDTAATTGLPSATGSFPALSLTGHAVDLSTCSAFVFNPDGTVYGDASSSRTAYVQYAADPAPSGSGNSTLKNYYDLVLSADSGGIHVLRP